MNISELITQQQFKEIILHAVREGEDLEYIETKDYIEQIKEKIMMLITSPQK